MLWGFDDKNGARGVTHHRLSSRTKQNAPEAGAAVRRDHYQINFSLARNAHDLRRRFAMHYQLLDIETRAVVTLRELRQFAFSRVFELLRDVRDRHWLGHAGITHR